MKMIVAVTTFLLGSVSVALAQSIYTTGTVASDEEVGYGPIYGYGGGLYTYAPRHFYSHAVGRLRR